MVQGENKAERQMPELEQMKRDYISVFSSAEGKRVLAHLEDICFINRTTFSSVEGKTLLNEGMRYVIVHIKNMLNFNIEKIRKLVEDNGEQ